MSETARFIREEVPIRTAIDPFRTLDCLAKGYDIRVKSGDDPDKVSLVNIIWALIVEAARTERALETAKGKGYGVGWPEPVHTPAEIFAARAARLESNLPEYEIARPRITPTAGEISRHSEVTVWLRFCHAADKMQARDVLWGRASGKGYPLLREETGLSIQRLKDIKSEQLRHIGKRLKDELKKAGAHTIFS